MDKNDILARIAELEREIVALPPGSVSAKKVRGKEYYYHRYTIDSKRSEIYIDFDAVEELRAQIDRRNALEAEVKSLKHVGMVQPDR